MRMSKFFTVLCIGLLMSTLVFAAGNKNDLAYIGVDELENATTPVVTDEVLIARSGVPMQGATLAEVLAVAQAGDYTFQSTLITTGRVNAILVLASSSTAITGANVPYSIIQKAIGSGGGLDETDGGIRLEDAKAGQILIITIVGPEGDGTFIVTPETTTGFTTLTFDTILDTATLMYFNDTIGWVVLSTTSVTVE